MTVMEALETRIKSTSEYEESRIELEHSRQENIKLEIENIRLSIQLNNEKTEALTLQTMVSRLKVGSLTVLLLRWIKLHLIKLNAYEQT